MSTAAALVSRNVGFATGPRTPAGKSKASKNALRHGVYAATVLLPDEDEGEYRRLVRRMRREFQPQSPFEAELVSRMVTTMWRLRRVPRLEVGVLEEHRYSPDGVDEGLGRALLRDHHHGGLWEKIGQWERGLQRGLLRDLHTWERMTARRRGEFVPAPATIDMDVDVSISAVPDPRQ
jgi:hypothetical protein